MEATPTSPAPSKPKLQPTVNSKEEFDAAIAAAKGPVLVDFIQEGCGHCEEETPAFEKLVTDCKGNDATILRVEVMQEWAGELADKLNVDGTPTALLAQSAKDFTDGKVREVTDLSSKALRSKLKCGR